MQQHYQHSGFAPHPQYGWQQQPVAAASLPQHGGPLGQMHPLAPETAPTPGPVAAGAGTVSRVRWGRLLLLVAGAALIGVGAWAGSHSGTPASKHAGSASTDATTDGGGTSHAMPGGSDAMVHAGQNATKSPTARVPVAPVVRRTTRTRRPASSMAAAAAAAKQGIGSRRTVTRSRAVAGGGAGVTLRAHPRGELPYTGLSTWIAGVLGVLLLALGICVHVNAVRIGMVAMLYRRGILLRPVDCARLAQQRGLGTARVFVSDLLHRLLEEPAGNDFVSARPTH